MNSGQPNILHIIQGATSNRGSDVGLSFMTLFVTTDDQWISPVYGKLKKIQLTATQFLCVSSWRRLSSSKLSFIKDSLYSTLSTGYNTWSRIPKHYLKEPQNIKSSIFFSTGFRMCVSISTSQSLAEKLMDIRYLFMATISEYSMPHKLILDKLKPPYPNLFVRWVVQRMRSYLPVLHDTIQNPHAFKFHVPVYDYTNTRLRESIGGTCQLPSLWSPWIMTDIQDIFDDIFVYVHTMKEPSSIYHESVKAVNTILEFQDKYNAMPILQQSGIHTVDTMLNLIKSRQQIGCWVDFVYNSAHLVANKLLANKNSPEMLKKCMQEPISEITSTKSCIPDFQRDMANIPDTIKKIKHNEVVEAHLKEIGENPLSRVPIRVIFKEIPENSILSQSGTSRHKVHDCVLDFISRHKDINTVLDLANWNIFKNSGTVLADICIKSQYGSKREFYVVNLGAKAMARVYENTFKCIAQLLPQEMISIPGDKKMLNMQSALDNIIRISERRDELTMFVNGDCSKWSASETMSSFWALCDGFGPLMEPNHKEFCKTVVACWGNKSITIPASILSNTRFITSKTQYLQKGLVMKSTQNFLQGMFNYSSSVKSVACTEFAIHMFKLMNPELVFYCNHLEHSDDYCLLVRVDDIKTFEKFRIYHRLSQRLHGIIDSSKKTNSQKYIMEFISLMSFGGQLSYPQIKKVKEVGVNISCLGFRTDAMTVVSRTGEAVRIGTPLNSAYVMQLIHNWNLSNCYSLSPGMRNDTISFNRKNLPLEVFGLPDCIPLVYTVTKGNPNTFRLYKYGSKETQSIIRGLYELGKSQTVLESIEDFAHVETLSELYTVGYIHKKISNKVSAIKSRLKITYLDAINFFEENPEYTIIKPRNTQTLKLWLEAMYFNSSFSQAYVRISRSQLTLRLSYFASKKCIIIDKNEYTIGAAQIELIKNATTVDPMTASQDFMYCLTCGDTSIQAYFDLTETLTVTTDVYNMPSKTTINYLPRAYDYLKFENQGGDVIQYVINNNNFHNDYRVGKGIASLERDKLHFMKNYGDNSSFTRSTLRNIMKEISINNRKPNVGMTCSIRGSLIDRYYIDMLENNSYPNQRYHAYPSEIFSITDPRTGEELYSKRFQFSKTINILAIDNLVQIYYLLYVRLRFDLGLVREFIKSTTFYNTNITMYDILSKMGYDQLKGQGATLNDLKAFAFMHSFVNENTVALRQYVKDHTNYFHCYITNESSPLFLESVAIKFKHSKFKAYLMQDGEIVLVSDTKRFTINCIGYYIAMKLFNKISSSQLQRKIESGTNLGIPKVKFSNISNILDYLSSRESAVCYQINNNQVSIVDFKHVKDCEPFLTLPNLVIPVKLSSATFYAEPRLSYENASVYLNKLKLYTLPLFDATDEIYIKSNFLLFYKELNISSFINSGFFLKYLQNKTFNKQFMISKLFTNDILFKPDFKNLVYLCPELTQSGLAEIDFVGFNKIYKLDSTDEEQYLMKLEEVKPIVLSTDLIHHDIFPPIVERTREPIDLREALVKNSVQMLIDSDDEGDNVFTLMSDEESEVKLQNIKEKEKEQPITQPLSTFTFNTDVQIDDVQMEVSDKDNVKEPMNFDQVYDELISQTKVELKESKTNIKEYEQRYDSEDDFAKLEDDQSEEEIYSIDVVNPFQQNVPTQVISQPVSTSKIVVKPDYNSEDDFDKLEADLSSDESYNIEVTNPFKKTTPKISDEEQDDFDKLDPDISDNEEPFQLNITSPFGPSVPMQPTMFINITGLPKLVDDKPSLDKDDYGEEGDYDLLEDDLLEEIKMPTPKVPNINLENQNLVDINLLKNMMSSTLTSVVDVIDDSEELQTPKLEELRFNIELIDYDKSEPSVVEPILVREYKLENYQRSIDIIDYTDTDLDMTKPVVPSPTTSSTSSDEDAPYLIARYDIEISQQKDENTGYVVKKINELVDPITYVMLCWCGIQAEVLMSNPKNFFNFYHLATKIKINMPDLTNTQKITLTAIIDLIKHNFNKNTFGTVQFDTINDIQVRIDGRNFIHLFKQKNVTKKNADELKQKNKNIQVSPMDEFGFCTITRLLTKEETVSYFKNTDVQINFDDFTTFSHSVRGLVKLANYTHQETF